MSGRAYWAANRERIAEQRRERRLREGDVLREAERARRYVRMGRVVPEKKRPYPPRVPRARCEGCGAPLLVGEGLCGFCVVEGAPRRPPLDLGCDARPGRSRRGGSSGTAVRAGKVTVGPLGVLKLDARFVNPKLMEETYE